MHTRLRVLGLALVVPFVVFCSDSGSNPRTNPNVAAWSQLSGGAGESLFRGVWGTSVDSLVAIGTDVPVSRSTRGLWHAVALPETPPLLNAIWADAPNNIYVGGAFGCAFHFDGNSWTSIPFAGQSSFLDIAGTPTGEVFACAEDVGGGPVVLKRTQTGWDYFEIGLPELNAIWAPSSNIIFVAGGQGYVARYDGSSFMPVSRTSSATWFDVWGSAADNVFVVGSEGTLGRYYVNIFFEMQSPVTADLRSVSGASSSNIFAVGDAGTILHFDGIKWTEQASGTTSNLTGVHMFQDGTAVAVGEYGTVLFFDGTNWQPVLAGEPFRFADAIGFDQDHVFFTGAENVTGGIVKHLDGRAWHFPGEPLTGIWGTTPTDVVVVGRMGVSYHFDGGTWTRVTNGSPGHLSAVAGAVAENGAKAFAVGANGNLRYSVSPFTSWRAMVPAATAIYDISDVWAAAPDNVWAVGPSCRILRYDGSPSLKWTAEETGMTGGAFVAISGRSATDITAVTDTGLVYHFNGKWRNVSPSASAPWVDVSCGPLGGLVAVSSLPHTLMIDALDLGTAPDPAHLGAFNCGWITSGVAYVAGAGGTIFRCSW